MYCNYSKGKFNNELTFIIPVWLDSLKDGKYELFEEDGSLVGLDCVHVDPSYKDYNESLILDKSSKVFLRACDDAELNYMTSINECGWTAQQAAEVLPQATKADVIMTGFVSDWQHIFNLRTSIIAETGQPHPEVSRLMDPLYEEFKSRKLIV